LFYIIDLWNKSVDWGIWSVNQPSIVKSNKIDENIQYKKSAIIKKWRSFFDEI